MVIAELLLGSDRASVLTQVRYIGICLRGDAQEWYIRHVESMTGSSASGLLSPL